MSRFQDLSAGSLLIVALLAAGCVGKPLVPAPPVAAADAKTLIEHALPSGVSDRTGWSEDMYGAFTSLTVAPSRENICAMVAVIEQESGFRVDPVIPGLGSIAGKEIESRAARSHVPMIIVNGVLQLKSSDGRSYAERIGAARTEKDLSDAYEDLIAAVPLGRTLFAQRNPIRTRGPMQVNVTFAEQFSAATPYPYPLRSSIEDELFSRRGSLYFGMAHLLDYRAPYDRFLYRFADFNAGQYASRNAAFQKAVGLVSGLKLAADGALLPHDRDGEPGATELTVRSIATRLKMSDGSIHAALTESKSRTFETTALYQRVFALADQRAGRPLARASVPEIKLTGPKITRNLTTDWYAHRVDGRFRRCLSAQYTQ